MRGPAAIIRAEERINHVEIPGKSGDLTETEGKNIYNSYIQTISISVRGGYRAREVYKWLRGSGYVTFSGEPNKKQAARVIGAITLNRISRNMDRWAGEVQFYCQPLKETLHEQKQTVTVSGSAVYNMGDVRAYPKYKITASGETVWIGIAGADTPEGNSLTITGQSSGNVIYVDADTMTAWKETSSGGGTLITDITDKTSGEFPVLGTGNNLIIFSGASSIEITKRERFL
jgi:phage-related protein